MSEDVYAYSAAALRCDATLPGGLDQCVGLPQVGGSDDEVVRGKESTEVVRTLAFFLRTVPPGFL